MFDYVRSLLDKSNVGQYIKINCDIPRWYDGNIYDNKSLNKWVIDKSDRVTIMDYVQELDQIIKGAAPHIDYANSYPGKSIFIALDTANDDPSTSTFWGTNAKTLEAAFNGIHDEFDGENSFGGVAVYHYDTYVYLSGVNSTKIPTDNDHVRDIYTYRNPYFTPGTDMNNVISFLKEHNVRTTYYQSTNGVMNDQANLAEFLNTAYAKGISVELLAGQKAWATTAG